MQGPAPSCPVLLGEERDTSARDPDEASEVAFWAGVALEKEQPCARWGGTAYAKARKPPGAGGWAGLGWPEDRVKDVREAGVACATCPWGRGQGRKALAGLPGASLGEVQMALIGLLASADTSAPALEEMLT